MSSQNQKEYSSNNPNQKSSSAKMEFYDPKHRITKHHSTKSSNRTENPETDTQKHHSKQSTNSNNSIHSNLSKSEKSRNSISKETNGQEKAGSKLSNSSKKKSTSSRSSKSSRSTTSMLSSAIIDDIDISDFAGDNQIVITPRSRLLALRAKRQNKKRALRRALGAAERRQPRFVLRPLNQSSIIKKQEEKLQSPIPPVENPESAKADEKISVIHNHSISNDEKSEEVRNINLSDSSQNEESIKETPNEEESIIETPNEEEKVKLNIEGLVAAMIEEEEDILEEFNQKGPIEEMNMNEEEEIYENPNNDLQNKDKAIFIDLSGSQSPVSPALSESNQHGHSTDKMSKKSKSSQKSQPKESDKGKLDLDFNPSMNSESASSKTGKKSQKNRNKDKKPKSKSEKGKGKKASKKAELVQNPEPQHQEVKQPEEIKQQPEEIKQQPEEVIQQLEEEKQQPEEQPQNPEPTTEFNELQTMDLQFEKIESISSHHGNDNPNDDEFNIKTIQLDFDNNSEEIDENQEQVVNDSINQDKTVSLMSEKDYTYEYETIGYAETEGSTSSIVVNDSFAFDPNESSTHTYMTISEYVIDEEEEDNQEYEYEYENPNESEIEQNSQNKKFTFFKPMNEQEVSIAPFYQENNNDEDDQIISLTSAPSKKLLEMKNQISQLLKSQQKNNAVLEPTKLDQADLYGTSDIAAREVKEILEDKSNMSQQTEQSTSVIIQDGIEIQDEDDQTFSEIFNSISTTDVSETEIINKAKKNAQMKQAKEENNDVIDTISPEDHAIEQSNNETVNNDKQLNNENQSTNEIVEDNQSEKSDVDYNLSNSQSEMENIEEENKESRSSEQIKEIPEKDQNSSQIENSNETPIENKPIETEQNENSNETSIENKPIETEQNENSKETPIENENSYENEQIEKSTENGQIDNSHENERNEPSIENKQIENSNENEQNEQPIENSNENEQLIENKSIENSNENEQNGNTKENDQIESQVEKDSDEEVFVLQPDELPGIKAQLFPPLRFNHSDDSDDYDDDSNDDIDDILSFESLNKKSVPKQDNAMLGNLKDQFTSASNNNEPSHTSEITSLTITIVEASLPRLMSSYVQLGIRQADTVLTEEDTVTTKTQKISFNPKYNEKFKVPIDDTDSDDISLKIFSPPSKSSNSPQLICQTYIPSSIFQLNQETSRWFDLTPSGKILLVVKAEKDEEDEDSDQFDFNNLIETTDDTNTEEIGQIELNNDNLEDKSDNHESNQLNDNHESNQVNESNSNQVNEIEKENDDEVVLNQQNEIEEEEEDTDSIDEANLTKPKKKVRQLTMDGLSEPLILEDDVTITSGDPVSLRLSTPTIDSNTEPQIMNLKAMLQDDDDDFDLSDNNELSD